MKLYSLTLNGYRRFAKTWINLEGNVIAIVGPNESGKSSLLRALTLLNSDDPIPPTALTRGTSFSNDHEVLRARFRLSDDERASVPYPLPPDKGIWLFVGKPVAGPRTYRFDPPIERPTDRREAATKTIRKAFEQPWFRKWRDEDEDVAAALEAVADSLETGAERIGDTAMDGMRAAIEHLDNFTKDDDRSKTALEGSARVRRAVEGALAIEDLPSPEMIARQCAPRVPLFLEFDDANRSLRSEYDIGGGGGGEPALLNLAAMAGLNLNSLATAVRSADPGGARSLLEGAQERLAAAFKDAWRQSSLRISFDREGTVLRITVSSLGTNFFSLDDRSDGVRAFIALRAFLESRHPTVAPLLLVDEAEAHLHYDAQADLVRMFEQQEDVEQVIYTTHSVGCLPQDVGRGIRVLVPAPNEMRTTIENVWSRGGVGITPLVRAMGARTVPLTPTRHVAIAEGASDPMILPSMIREATGARSLEYQVVGGLAEASEVELRQLSKEAPRVVYLVDGDAGGAALRGRLRAADVADAEIVEVPGGFCLEDLVDPRLYVRAVNEYLRSWPSGTSDVLEVSDLPEQGRPGALKAWCEARAIDVPSKVHVAESVLRVMSRPTNDAELSWADARRLETLIELDVRIRAVMEIEGAGPTT